MITLKNVVLRRGSKVILDSASITLNPGENVGLVGRNGAGKSSLFAMLNGSLHEDGGEFYIPGQWRMAQVAQDMPETEQSATDYVIEGDIVLTAAQAEVTASEESGDGDRMAHAYMELYDSGAHDAQARAQALILGLGFKVSELDNPVNSFSGGWRMRLQLARALMCPSDLLLLDEPTNHLDLATREALSMALNEFEGTVMLVSHDRALLRAVCDEFWMVSRGGVEPFDGDLDDYQRYLLDEAKRLREEAKKSANSPAAVAIKTVASPALPSSDSGTFDTNNNGKKSDSKKEDAQRRQQQSAAAKPLRKDLEKIDRQLQSLNSEKGNLESLLTTSKLPAEIAQAGKRLKAIEADLASLEERWLELTEKLEAVAA